MTSADFCHPIALPRGETSQEQDDRSLRVRRVTFIPYTRRIYALLLRMTVGFESFGPLAPRPDALYAVRVPRAGILRTASFRFSLTRDTLAVRLVVPVIIVHRRLSLPSHFRFAFDPRLKAA